MNKLPLSFISFLIIYSFVFPIINCTNSPKRDAMYYVEIGYKYLNYSERPDHTRALANFEHAISLNKNCILAYIGAATVYNTRAKVSVALGEDKIKSEIYISKMFTFLNAAYDIEPYNFTLLKSIGFVYFDWGKFRRAIAFLTKAKELNPNDNAIIYNLGFAYAFTHQYAKAISELDIFIKKTQGKFPKFIEVLENIKFYEEREKVNQIARDGLKELEDNRLKKAEQLFKIALEKWDKCPLALLGKAKIYISHLLEAKSQNNNDETDKYYDLALYSLKKALAIDKSNPVIYDTIIELMNLTQRHQNLMEYFREKLLNTVPTVEDIKKFVNTAKKNESPEKTRIFLLKVYSMPLLYNVRYELKKQIQILKK